MSPFSVQCFKPGSKAPSNSFFILSKGQNTGRPSSQSNPNCFVFTCEDPGDLHNYYWLVYALWEGKHFRGHLCGSVVLFIHIRELKAIISEAALQVHNIEKISITMQQVLQLEKKLENQLKLLRQAKQGLLRSSLQKHRVPKL